MPRTAKQQAALKKAQAASAAKRRGKGPGKTTAVGLRTYGKATFAARHGDKTFASSATGSSALRRPKKPGSASSVERVTKRYSNKERAQGVRQGALIQGASKPKSNPGVGSSNKSGDGSAKATGPKAFTSRSAYAGSKKGASGNTDAIRRVKKTPVKSGTGFDSSKLPPLSPTLKKQVARSKANQAKAAARRKKKGK